MLEPNLVAKVQS